MLIFQFYFTRLIFIGVNTFFALILQLRYDLSISILKTYIYFTIMASFKSGHDLTKFSFSESNFAESNYITIYFFNQSFNFHCVHFCLLLQFMLVTFTTTHSLEKEWWFAFFGIQKFFKNYHKK